jgi:ankyrin repeat protein
MCEINENVMSYSLEKLLCERGSLEDIVNSSDELDWSECLVHACNYNRKDVAKLAISNGANVNAQDLVYNMCIHGDIEMVNILIENGLSDRYFRYVFLSACNYGHRDIAKLMMDKGIDDYKEGLRSACIDGFKDIVQDILSRYKCAYMTFDVFYAIFVHRWVDMICKRVYFNSTAHYYIKNIKKCYDVFEVFETSVGDQISNMNIKLFDRNLFCVSNSNDRVRNKRNSNGEIV